MSKILENIEPKKAMHYFEEISKIPRASKKEKQISDYLVKFAQDRGLDVIQDKALNVLIKKEATEGYEHVPTVIIQGHMDMVCEKNQDTDHDFDKEGIKLRIKDGFVMGTGTTLGADNGIAVAFGLALLDSQDIPHPALELIVTSDEEEGMGGAIALDPKLLSGKILINIDTEEEGEIYVSCAGGARGNYKVSITKIESNYDKEQLSIKVRGLSGGHSGCDIHLQKGNSNKLIGRFLNKLLSKIEFNLVEISGGAKDNAIPREADAIIEISKNKVEVVEELIKKYNVIYRNELRKPDPDLVLSCEKVEKKSKAIFDADSTRNVISALFLHPNGIKRMSDEIEGLVESSLNVGVVETTSNVVRLKSAIRSSVLSEKLNMIDELYTLASGLNDEFEDVAHYPAWEYRADSKIRDLFFDIYKNKYGKEPKIKAIHAGLECGIFDEKLDNVDMISIGPNIFGAHTPEERLEIASTQRTWEYFIEGLKEIKNYY